MPKKSHKKAEKPDLFRKLKRHFVMNAVLLSSAIVVIAFSAIYFIVARSFNRQKPIENDLPFRSSTSDPFQKPEPLSDELNMQIRNTIEDSIRLEREKSLETLLFTLITTGIGIEIIVAIASLWAAENSIKPVREAYKAQKDFVSNASHELKTPLAVIQANLEAADIQDNHWLNNAMQKVEEATELNNSLLALARMDQAATTPAKKSNLRLDKLVQKTADFYLPKCQEKGITLEFFAPGATEIPGTQNVTNTSDAIGTISVPRAELTQLLNILLDNAVKYAGKSIKITVARAKISIENDGATIAKDQLAHIFDRFYQVDKSKPGVGLGLSIAKTLADKNNWKLEAKSDQKTTTFTLKLS